MIDAHFRFHDIQKRFGPRPLLAIDALELQPGQCTALVGRNGAGKTTLLKILAGLERPQQAWVSRDGGPTQPWSQARAALRRDVVYLHQFAYMFDASVAENVGYGLACTHVPTAQRRPRILAALARVDLAHLLDADAKRLSGGERQRAALARALVLEPKLLLLDEPTASMDPQARQQTVALLRQLKQGGLSTVIVTHDLSTLGALPDTRLQLADGEITTLAPTPTRREHNDPFALLSRGPVLPRPLWGLPHV